MKERPILMRVVDRVLQPADAYSRQRCAALKTGVIVQLAEYSARNERRHRLYWALLTKVVDAGCPWDTPEALHNALKEHLGYYDWIETVSGDRVKHLHSIAFDRMSEANFRKYLDAAINVICDRILPGVEKSALIAEVHDMLGGKAA